MSSNEVGHLPCRRKECEPYFPNVLEDEQKSVIGTESIDSRALMCEQGEGRT